MKAWKTSEAYQHKEVYLRARGGSSSRSAATRWRIEPEEIADASAASLKASVASRLAGMDPDENPKVYVEAVPTGSTEVVDSWSWSPPEEAGGAVKAKSGQSSEGAAIVALTGAVIRAMDFNTKIAIASQETALGMVEKWHEAKSETLAVTLEASDEIAKANESTDAMDRAIKIFEPLIPLIGAAIGAHLAKSGVAAPGATPPTPTPTPDAAGNSSTAPQEAAPAPGQGETPPPPVRSWDDLSADEKGDAVINAVRRLLAEHPDQAGRLMAAYMGGQ